jgi:hypothetical protein
MSNTEASVCRPRRRIPARDARHAGAAGGAAANRARRVPDATGG